MIFFNQYFFRLTEDVCITGLSVSFSFFLKMFHGLICKFLCFACSLSFSVQVVILDNDPRSEILN